MDALSTVDEASATASSVMDVNVATVSSTVDALSVVDANVATASSANMAKAFVLRGRDLGRPTSSTLPFPRQGPPLLTRIRQQQEAGRPDNAVPLRDRGASTRQR